MSVIRLIAGYLASFLTALLVGAPFFLKSEYCVKPSLGGALVAGITGAYLSCRLLGKAGSLGGIPIGPDMPASIRFFADTLAVFGLAFALWVAFGSCQGSTAFP